MKIVKLTSRHGTHEPVYLNPEYIVSLQPIESDVVIQMHDGPTFRVIESVETIRRTILGEDDLSQ